ncbi:lantibiotic dehydratase [Xanthocytophaga agilis]|uniref:Lantibiotic dehydratase n=1 Tax=Xanthocytophaga agilis TaxID=3048010 RepID=A0AAE3R8D3_9BACT|nr:lantibiotic dehydratase [Xanthocytophaga agilis]MDJ1503290.1 lantibiotic dehydratase [Xanthocytophaga agilis]
MIEDFGFIIIRTPLLPIYSRNGNTQQYTSCLADIHSDLELLNFLNNDLFKEALLLSSQELFHAYEKLMHRKQDLSASDKKVVNKLLKYYLRISHRSTPYGVSAGLASINIADSTKIELNRSDKHKKKVRLNFDFITQYLKRKYTDKEFLFKGKFFSNNTIYKNFRGLHYIKGDNYPFSKMTVENTSLIESIIKYTKRKKNFSQIRKFILNRVTQSEQDVDKFIFHLIDNYLLLPDFYPDILSDNITKDFQKRLKQQADNQDLLLAIAEIERLNQTKIGQGFHSYIQIGKYLKNLDKYYSNVDLLHSDMYLSFKEKQINKNVLTEIYDCIHYLNKLKADSSNSRLRTFIQKFRERYGSKEVNLADVLDTITGIGYPVESHLDTGGNEFLKGLAGLSNNSADQFMLNSWDLFLFNKYLKSKDAFEKSMLVLSEEDLSEFKSAETSAKDLPSSLFSCFRLIAQDEDAIDKGNFLIDYIYTGGPSSINLLSRFANLDSDLDQKLQKCINAEEEGINDIIFAEIIHAPSGKASNVVTKTDFRKFEIPLLNNSDSSAIKLNIDDLTVYCSDNKVILKSRSLNRIVKPRLTSAHNYTYQALNFYYFLSDLHFQDGLYGLYWNWGNLMGGFKHLPRVVYKKCILSKESWIIELSDFDHLFENKQLPSYTKVQNYFSEVKIPQQFLIKGGNDLNLYINLESKVCFDLFWEELSKNRSLKIEECLFSANQCFITNETGKYSHEFVLPLKLNKNELNLSANAADITINRQIVTDFFPGSQWLQVNIFCNFQLMDEIIVHSLQKVLISLISQKIVEGYFFVKFNAPDSHIRLRLKVKVKSKIFRILDLVNKKLKNYIQAGSIWSIQLDSYKREIDRYTLDYDQVEHFFYMDSYCTIAILETLNTVKLLNSHRHRIIVALLSCQGILEKVGLSPEEKSNFIENLSSNFKNEFQLTSVLEHKKILANNFRQIKQFLKEQTPILMSQIKQIITDRDAQSSEFYSIIQALSYDRKCRIIESILHMCCNRILITHPRLNEVVIYDFIKQSLKSEKYNETILSA